MFFPCGRLRHGSLRLRATTPLGRCRRPRAISLWCGVIKVLKAAQPCPCTSGLRYGDCCRPLHRGETATTPLSLMRSRYAAFAIGDVAYVDATQHPEHVDQLKAVDERRRQIRAFCRSARFAGLKIVGSADDGDDALVLFVARVFVGRDDQTFMECSRFRNHASTSRYLSGDLEDDVAMHGGVTGIAAFQTRARAAHG